ncbi:MAG: hypothetical protein NTY77_03080, partial [Elusimicrobia bacterium]|nr:hypothetical protein [Elusimicrobiota bacterium]
KVSLSSGGTNADNSGAGQGGLFYMATSSIVATSALTGVLKGNNTGAPSAMTGTATQIAYWSNANTIAATQYVALLNGGMNATNAGAAPGALFYMAGSSIVATSALTGVLKGNGAGAPTGNATLADIGETGTYSRFTPGNVTITGGSVVGTILAPVQQLKTYFLSTQPTAVGEMYYCTDCLGTTKGEIIISTGTTTGAFANAAGESFW